MEGGNDFLLKAATFGAPNSLADLVEAEFRRHPLASIMGQSRFKPLREAWVAAQFALCYEAHVRPCEVRIVDPKAEFPDFEIRCGEAKFGFESRIVLEPGRKLGEDFRSIVEPGQKRDVFVSLDRMPETDFEIIEDAIRAKELKNYAGQVSLAIYLDFQGRDVNRARLQEICRRVGVRFESIWFLAEGHPAGRQDIPIRSCLLCGKASESIGTFDGWKFSPRPRA